MTTSDGMSSLWCLNLTRFRMDCVGLVVFFGNKASRTLHSSIWGWDAALSKKIRRYFVSVPLLSYWELLTIFCTVWDVIYIFLLYFNKTGSSKTLSLKMWRRINLCNYNDVSLKRRGSSHRTTPRHISENSLLHNHRYGNFKSSLRKFLVVPAFKIWFCALTCK